MNKSGRGLNTYAQTNGCMTEDSSGQEQPADKNDSRDEIIRKRSFSRARGIDIASFMIDDTDEKDNLWTKAVEEVEEEKDIAMGEIAEIFSKGGEDFDRAGAIQKDGTVKTAPEMDSVTDLAVYGEKKVGLWATNCHDFFMVANRHNSWYSFRPYIWGNWPHCNGNRRVIPRGKMDTESKHENFGGHLGNYFDEINLRFGIGFMALGLVRRFLICRRR